MAHTEQQEFCQMVREKYPGYFNNTNVLDVGSLDINGNNRPLFHKCKYRGIDIAKGKNVDEVISCKDFLKQQIYNETYDVIISTNALEHDRTWDVDLALMYRGLKPGGLLLISAAGISHHEHGTYAHTPFDSPATNDYYRNVSIAMFMSVLPQDWFTDYFVGHDSRQNDFQFYGIKKFFK